MFERQAIMRSTRRTTPEADARQYTLLGQQPLPEQPQAHDAAHMAPSSLDFGKIAILPPEEQESAGGGMLGPALSDRIRAQRDGGAPLDTTAQRRMEGAFGHTFADVRVHADSDADALNQSLGAGAFTVGSDIFLSQQVARAGNYGGDALLAHELTHVVQQRDALASGNALTVQAANSAPEREAESVAAVVASGGRAPTGGRAGDTTAPTVQRIPFAALPAIVGNLAPGGPSAQPEVDAISGADAKALGTHRPLSLEERVRVLEIKDAAKTLDREWEKKFDARLSSHRQALLRITGAMEQASVAFTDAQSEQAKTDQIKFQLIAGVAAVGFAVGFEWAFAGMLGKLGVQAQRVESLVEKWENPANAAVSAGGGNVGGAIVGGSGSKPPDLGSVGAGGQANLGGITALDFFTHNGELLEHEAQKMDEAFLNRVRAMTATMDDDWLSFDIHAQDALYAKLYADLEAAGSGVEELKDQAEIAKVIEYHMWILWLKGKLQGELSLAAWNRHMEGEDENVTYEDVADELDFGVDIGRRLTKNGIAAAAGVGLAEHWYERGSDDWDKKLMHWAENYRGTISLK